MDGKATPAAFGRLMAELRPRLHRYCARMVGSAFDGEDVVQDALAKAAEAFGAEGRAIAHPEGWLFRIAHNTALDALRHRSRHRALSLDAGMDEMADGDAAADSRVAATAALAAFMKLPPVPRSSVILIDVLGHSLAETAGILDISLAALKAALHRGRRNLQEAAAASDLPTGRLPEAERDRLRAYADRFNDRDFDALRALLADDVRLDLVNRARRAGRADVATYFTRYVEAPDCRLSVGLADGRAALLAEDPSIGPGGIAYVVLLEWDDDRITAIRDFRYAPYVVESLAIARS